MFLVPGETCDCGSRGHREGGHCQSPGEPGRGWNNQPPNLRPPSGPPIGQTIGHRLICELEGDRPSDAVWGAGWRVAVCRGHSGESAQPSLRPSSGLGQVCRVPGPGCCLALLAEAGSVSFRTWRSSGGAGSRVPSDAQRTVACRPAKRSFPLGHQGPEDPRAIFLSV